MSVAGEAGLTLGYRPPEKGLRLMRRINYSIAFPSHRLVTKHSFSFFQSTHSCRVFSNNFRDLIGIQTDKENRSSNKRINK